MGCFHPLLGIVQPIKTETGKNKIDVVKFTEERLNACREKEIDYVLIPCGKCIGCRLEYSRQWANRMMMELEYHDSAYFITLTYSDDFLPKNPVWDEETGEYLRDSVTLRKAHLSKFMKHLRKHFPKDKIKFYGVGEFGSHTFRPHYHIIVYGLHLDDLTLYKRTKQGDCLYISDKLNKCWSNFYGYDSHGIPRYDQIGWVVVAPVTWETCAYVARYVTKKMSGPYADLFDKQNMEIPFSLMSRNPGIGNQWYKDHKDFYKYDYINLKSGKKDGTPLKFRPPKYFDKLLEEDIPEVFKVRKENKNKFFNDKMEALLRSLDKPYLQYLADKECELKDRIKVLDRKYV